jgi:hypothetical protein
MAPNAHRPLFITAGWFNVLAGLPLLVATATMAGIMGLPLNPTATMFIQLTATIIVVFGGAYWMIARDPDRFRPYIPLGIILKAAVIVIFYGHWLAGNIPWPLPTLAAGDIVFGVLFWRYYKQTSNRVK